LDFRNLSKALGQKFALDLVGALANWPMQRLANESEQSSPHYRASRWTKKAGVISGRFLSGILTKILDISRNPHFATVLVQHNAI
jgi:hypothetical protein